MALRRPGRNPIGGSIIERKGVLKNYLDDRAHDRAPVRHHRARDCTFSFSAPPNGPVMASDARDLREVVEMAVAIEESELVLQDQGRDPDVVRGDGCPLPP